MQAGDMTFWLCKFAMEARRKDQKPYPPDTLHCICCGLFRALKEGGRGDVKPFSDPGFVAFTGTLDARMKELKSSGEYQHKKAGVITAELEEHLWEKG